MSMSMEFNDRPTVPMRSAWPQHLAVALIGMTISLGLLWCATQTRVHRHILTGLGLHIDGVEQRMAQEGEQRQRIAARAEAAELAAQEAQRMNAQIRTELDAERRVNGTQTGQIRGLRREVRRLRSAVSGEDLPAATPRARATNRRTRTATRGRR